MYGTQQVRIVWQVQVNLLLIRSANLCICTLFDKQKCSLQPRNNNNTIPLLRIVFLSIYRKSEERFSPTPFHDADTFGILKKQNRGTRWEKLPARTVSKTRATNKFYNHLVL